MNDETRALREGCAVWIDAESELVEMLGEDRHRFLNGLITTDVLELPEGSGCHGLFTTIKGRILADVVVSVLPDRIWLRLPPGRGSAIVGHLARYIITDRVELVESSERVRVTLGGAAAGGYLGGWLEEGELPTEPGAHVEMSLLGTAVRLVREPRADAAYSIWMPADEAARLVGAMQESVTPPVLVGAEAVESARIDAGVPRFGVDFDEETFPQEADLDSAVSYEKGCYLGQEVVARIHFRGGVNRILRGLEVAGDAVVEPGAGLFSHGEPVGTVTSASGSGSNRALGLVAISAADPGASLELETGSSVRLVALPFE